MGEKVQDSCLISLMLVQKFNSIFTFQNQNHNFEHHFDVF